jgi:hypothetical protein
MLEDDAALRTWALDVAPDAAPFIRAIQLPHHRKHYLTYEGPVSGNRGHVRQWDAGTFQWKCRDDELVQVVIAGGKLRGEIHLSIEGDCWQLQYLPSNQPD